MNLMVGQHRSDASVSTRMCYENGLKHVPITKSQAATSNEGFCAFLGQILFCPPKLGHHCP